MRVARPVQWGLVGVIPNELRSLVWSKLRQRSNTGVLSNGFERADRIVRCALCEYGRRGHPLSRDKAVSMKRTPAMQAEFRLWLLNQSKVKAGENPVRGVRACASEFAQRGWRGELFFGDKEYRNDYSGDRVKRPAVKSSTMKGSIEYERKGLPVRFRGDGAEQRMSGRERYPKLLLS